ncbi:MAG: hypothetical protein U1F11_15400 [Steroidobacteraceae bacterium]
MKPTARHVLAAALVALAFCSTFAAAPARAGWKLAAEGTPFKHAASGYSVQFPPGWRYDKLWFSDESGATRDGPFLQSIFVDFRAHKNAFKAIKKSSTADELPQDLAQDLIGDMTKERSLENVTILSNVPQVLADRPGFRVTFEYKMTITRGAVRYREIIVGATGPKGLYLIGYRAPVIYYYDRDVAAFETALATFQIAAATPTRK